MDLLEKPKLSPDARVLDAPGLPAGKILKQVNSGDYYELGDDVILLLQLMDGNRNVNELVKAMEDKGERVDETYVKEIVDFLAKEGLVSGMEWMNPSNAQVIKKLRIESAFEFDAVLVPDSTQAFRAWLRYLSPILNKYSLAAAIAFIGVGFVLYSNEFSSVLAHRENFEVSGSVVFGFLFYFFAIFVPVICLHEFAHGIALAKYGGEPGEMGIGVFYFGLMFYVDTSDSVRLPKRQRIMVSLAGLIVNLMFGSMFALMSLYLPPGAAFIGGIPTPWQILRMGAFFCFFFSLFWFLPLIENDGYYALADFLGDPNIRGRALDYMKSKLGLAREEEETRKLTAIERSKLVFFALVVISFVVFLVIGFSPFVYYVADDVRNSLNIIALELFANSQPQTSLIRSLTILGVFSLCVAGFMTFVLKSRRYRARSR